MWLLFSLAFRKHQSVEEVKSRHKKEVKALDGTGRKLIKQANKNKKKVAEAEAKIAEVGAWVDKWMVCWPPMLTWVLLLRYVACICVARHRLGGDLS